MFGRRNKQSRRTVGPTTRTDNPAFDGFRFAVSTLEYPSAHPHYAKFYAFFTYNGGPAILIVTPFFSGQQSLRFDLPALPTGEWVQLSDPAGRPIPIEVFVDAVGALGRWLP